MAAQETKLDPSDITIAPGQEPFTLLPVIRDILRTRYCLPGSIFLVEGVQTAPVSKSGRWRAMMLVLGDGELCIQALLGDTVHRFVELGDVSVGSYVRVDGVELRWKDIHDENGKLTKKITYLVVQDLLTVGWNNSFRALWQRQADVTAQELASEHDLDFKEMGLEYTAYEVDKAQGQSLSKSQDLLSELDEDDGAAIEDAFEAFEARTFPRRPPKASKTIGSANHPAKKGTETTTRPRTGPNPSQPLKLTTLHSIPRLPYAQNWSCNVLAIVSSISDIEPSHLPPYRQRTARIADPSTAKRVHLTVFLDPEEFAPKVGSAVLLVGVKNHRFDGGSLKKYASDKKEGKWWYEEPWEMTWCDVAGIKSWWAQVERSVGG